MFVAQIKEFFESFSAHAEFGSVLFCVPYDSVSSAYVFDQNGEGSVELVFDGPIDIQFKVD